MLVKALLASARVIMASPRISLLVLKTAQLETLRRFYEALGVQLRMERHGKGPVHYAGQIGHVVLEVYPLPDAETAADRTTRLGFAVTDLRQILSTLEGQGAEVVTPINETEGGLYLVVRDPDGRTLELRQGIDQA